MRITGGNSRGIKLITVPGGKVRPATDAMREAVFASLGPLIENAVFLDVFAGSGSYGLEAMSRGAASGTFVEKNNKAIGVIKRNIAFVLKNISKEESDFTLEMKDAFKWKARQSFDLIFLDPPYPLARERGAELLTLMEALLEPGKASRIMFEVPGDMQAPEHPALTLNRELGKSKKDAPKALIYKRLAT